jgi:hypothetical protein
LTALAWAAKIKVVNIMRVNALSLGLLIGCVASTALSDERKANSEITDADRAFWSFRPIEETPVPDGSQHPIDAFIRDRLEGDTLQASPKADKRTLMRRVFADGTGMPPAPDESARFMDDPAEDAYEQLVDRVLASPHFGERWARHWLDVARFAESGGFELDGDRPLAYQYRDFVIKAFNDDLPYNQFVQWQIAGDEFAPDNREALKATGFLGCGVRNAVITKNQVEKERYDELDEILGTTGVAMLGLSIGCARCHDHKYDPINTIDYYRMLSTFTTTVRSEIAHAEPTEAVDKAIEVFNRDHQELVAALTRHESKMVPRYTDETIAHQSLKLSPWLATEPFQTTGHAAGHAAVFSPETTPGSGPDPSLSWLPRPDLSDGKNHVISKSNSVFYFHRTITAASTTPTVLSFGADDTIKAWLDGELIANRIIAGAVNPDQAIAQVTLTKGEHHLLFKVVNGAGIGGLYFKVKEQGMPAEMKAIAKIPLAQRNPQQSEKLVNWSRPFDPEWKRLTAEIATHLTKKPRYAMETIFVSTEGRKGFRPRIYNVQGPEFYPQTYVLKRGDANDKIAPATQSFLQVLMNHDDAEQHWIEEPPAGSVSTYRRKSLALWLTDNVHGAGNLLARVIVNRLWQHHFKEGLVATPNDFGTQGTRPTHPDLLEWLAGELIRNDWSLKHIHRLILTSETFQQASAFSESAAKIDPENRLLWRFTPRRLEAEAIRDSILAVSGQLDRTMYGSGTLDSRQKRRSIYFTVKRSLLNPMLNLYDAPETLTSAGRRSSTTTAPQALLLVNNPNIREWASAFATRFSTQPTRTLSDAVHQAYSLAFNRAPSPTELSVGVQFVEAQQAEYRTGAVPNASHLAFTDFALALFSLNEFIYLD